MSRWLAWIVVFFTSFFGGFHLLGYVNLFTNLPVVDSRYASILALVFVVFVGLRRWLGERKHGGSPTDGNAVRSHHFLKRFSLPGNRLARTLAAASIVTGVMIALMLSAGFPRGYEAQGYHLPIGVHIFQAHSLKVWQVWKPVFFHTLPANASIYYGFLLWLTPEHLVAPANLAFLVPLAVAAYGIARATGADKTASLLAALGLVTIPVLVVTAMDAVSDVGGLAFLAVAVYFVVSRPTGRHQDLVLSGLAAGLAFGFKSLHLVGVAFLSLTIMLQAWSTSTGHAFQRRLWSASRPLSVFGASVLVTAGFWLVRNYVQLGNPLYPVHLRMFDVLGWTAGDMPEPLMPQSIWVGSSAGWLSYPWVEWLRPGDNVFYKRGPGPFFAATVPVACLLAGLALLKGEIKQWLVISALLGGGLFILIVQMWVINDRQPRHFMGALVFLVPLVAWTMSLATGPSRKMFEFVVVLCISFALLMALSLESVEFGTRFIYGRQFTRALFYSYPEMIDHLPSGSTIINLGYRTRNYSLLGARRQNRIVNYVEAISALQASLGTHTPDEPPELIPLPRLVLRQLGATHLITEGVPKIVPDECIGLKKIDVLDKDIFGNALSDPVNLYEIEFCKGA